MGEIHVVLGPIFGEEPLVPAANLFKDWNYLNFRLPHSRSYPWGMEDSPSHWLMEAEYKYLVILAQHGTILINHVSSKTPYVVGQGDTLTFPSGQASLLGHLSIMLLPRTLTNKHPAHQTPSQSLPPRWPKLWSATSSVWTSITLLRHTWDWLSLPETQSRMISVDLCVESYSSIFLFCWQGHWMPHAALLFLFFFRVNMTRVAFFVNKQIWPIQV